MLINTNPFLGYARPLMPNTKQIGFAHVEPPQPIDDEDLSSFMDASDVVILSFGSIKKPSEFITSTFEKFLDAFSDFPNLNFIIKFDKVLSNLPKNVKLLNWFNLADALAHSNVKFFITHGGIHSSYEAIDREVPMIVFPFCYDQEINAKMLVRNEIAIEMDFNSFTVNDLKSAIAQMLTGKFKENVKALKKIINDVPEKPMDVAIKNIEFIIRNKDSKRIRIEPASDSIHFGFKIIFAIFVVYLTLRIFKS